MPLHRRFWYNTMKRRSYNVMTLKEDSGACCLRVAASSNKKIQRMQKAAPLIFGVMFFTMKNFRYLIIFFFCIGFFGLFSK